MKAFAKKNRPNEDGLVRVPFFLCIVSQYQTSLFISIASDVTQVLLIQKATLSARDTTY